jgi:hypothetical protein
MVDVTEEFPCLVTNCRHTMIAEVDEPNACALAIEAGLGLYTIGLGPGNPTLD